MKSKKLVFAALASLAAVLLFGAHSIFAKAHFTRQAPSVSHQFATNNDGTFDCENNAENDADDDDLCTVSV